MDNKAFEVLFEVYYKQLVTIAYNYLQNEEDAKGIVQKSFLKLWEKRNTISQDTNINAYIFKIVKNNCLDFLKHQKVKIQYANNYKSKQASINYFALKDEEESHIIQSELGKEINKAINTLPEARKNIFIMSRVNGLKNKEIASELQISIRTVENQIFKALKQVRSKLQHLKMLLF